jgi:hypothetical protein
MARFSQKDIFFKDGDMAVFGDSQDSKLYWDGSNNRLVITTTISGVTPIEAYHLATKNYVDTVSGSINNNVLKKDGSIQLTSDWNLGTYSIYLNDTSNANQTIGFTINQEANTDELVAFKSSAVDHGITNKTETDTFGFVKRCGDSGGLRISGFSEAVRGLRLAGRSTTENTDNASTSRGVIHLRGDKKSGTGVTALSDNAALFTVRNGDATKLILSGNGDLKLIGGLTTEFVKLNAEPENNAFSGTIVGSSVSDVTKFGQGLYLDSDGTYKLANATDSSAMPCVALSTVSGTGTNNILLQGFARNDDWDWTPGGPIFVDTTSGELTQITISGSGNVVQAVGFATHADRMFFNPDYTTVTAS